MTTLREQDFEQISAYLDGELSSAEQLAFERRLAQEPQLQAELEAMRSTIAIVSMVEHVAVPRDFRLDPAVYNKPRRQSWFERLNLKQMMPLVAAGAAAIVVFIFVGVFLLRGRGAGLSGVAMAPDEEPMPETMADDSMRVEDEEQAEEEMMDMAAEEAESAAEAAPAEEEATEEPVEADADMPEEPAQGGGYGGGGDGEGGGETQIIPPPNTPQPYMTLPATSKITSPTPTLSEEELPSAPAGDSGEEDEINNQARLLMLVIIVATAGVVVSIIGLVVLLVIRRKRN